MADEVAILGSGGGGSSSGAPKLVPTAVKTSNYAAAASDLVPVDTTGGPVTVTLPTAPADGSRVAVKHVTQGGTNTVTVAAGGTDVFNKAGGGTSVTLPLLNQAVNLQYQASSGIWYVISDDLSLATLDGRYPMQSLLTAKGSIFVATGAGVVAQLAVGADGTVPQADSTQAGGVGWKQRSRSIADVHADASIVGDGATGPTDTPLVTLALPTTLAAGDVVRCRIVGDALNNSGGTITNHYRVKVGATTVIDWSGSVATSTSRRVLICDIELLVVATNDERLLGMLMDGPVSGGGAAAPTFGSPLTGPGYGTAAEDLTAGKNLVFSALLGSNAVTVDTVVHAATLTVAKR